MDLHIHRGATRLAGVRQNPLEQFGPAEPLAFEGSVVDGCRQVCPEWQPAESSDQRCLPLPRYLHFQDTP